jgi:hypothetical protein
MLEKKLSVKVQSNLARFKVDLQNLRIAVDTLKKEQSDLEKKPIQQILGAINILLHLSGLIFLVALIDLFTSDWIVEAH